MMDGGHRQWHGRSLATLAVLLVGGCIDTPAIEPEDTELRTILLNQTANCSINRGHIKIDDLGGAGIAVSTEDLCGCRVLAQASYREQGSVGTSEAMLNANLYPHWHRFENTAARTYVSARTFMVCPSIQATAVAVPAETHYIKHPICLASPEDRASAFVDPERVGTGLLSARRWDPVDAQYVVLADDEPVAPGEVVLLTYDPEDEQRRLLHTGELRPLEPLVLYPGDNLVTTPLDMGCMYPHEILELLGPEGYSIGVWDPAVGVTFWYPESSCPPPPNAGGSDQRCDASEAPLPGCSPIHVYFEPPADFTGPLPTWPPVYEAVERYACDATDGA